MIPRTPHESRTMRRQTILGAALACMATMAGAAVQAAEDKPAASIPRSANDKGPMNIELLHTLDGKGGFIRLEGNSLLLTTDLKKDPHAGYWFNLEPEPRRPSLVCDTLPGGWDVAVAGNHAYVCDYTKTFAVYRMHDDHWHATAKLEMPSMTENIIVRGNLAYIANHVAGLTIVDISTPSKPSIISNFNPKIDCDAIGLCGDCAILYGHWESRLVLVDVSDPAKPRQTGVYQNAPKTFTQGEMAVAGGFAYCTAVGGLVIVDTSDQKNPKLAKFVDLGGRVTDVVVEDRYAFLAAGPKGVFVLDVSDPGNPNQVGRYPAGKGFAAAQIAVKRVDDTPDYLVYVANPRGPATVLLFGAPVFNGGQPYSPSPTPGLR